MDDPTTRAADWVTEPKEAAGLEAREVYAHAGLALYQAQCLEHEIVNSLGVAAIVRILGAKRPMTSSEIAEYQAQVDHIWEENYELTLGQLLKSLRSSGVTIPASLDADLRQSLEARNRLVHRYFRERAETWFESDGRRSMAFELMEMEEVFRRTDRALHDATSKMRKAVGITEEIIIQIAELMKAGASDDEIDRAIDKHRNEAK